ncbi:dermonecrotic toxin domain-containing protein [Pseudomonas orientalis]|uniref:dermonecrotic toxin domain-containing protein n=1 Tax=Pseudomonas orientalis TaxID=76758 RepID=UPI002FE1F5F7
MQLASRLSSTPSASLWATQDNDYKAHYRNQLEGIDKKLQVLRARPTFSSFLNERVNAIFPSTAKPLDASRVFIESDSSDATVEPDADQVTRLLPSLMDAVVRRIVDDQPATYANRRTRFTFDRDEAADQGLPSSLTPVAFDAFLDDLAGSLQTAYKTCLDAFWNKADTAADPRSHKQRVILARSLQISLEASLLRADGTLNSNGLLLVEAFVAYPDAVARQTRPNGPAGYSLVLKGTTADMPLHGALVLTSQGPSDPPSADNTSPAAPVARRVEPSASVGIVVLFTPNRGLEAFPSLALLDQELHRRLNTDYEFDSLFTLLANKDCEPATTLRDRVPATGCFAYEEIFESVFSTSVASQYEKLIEDLAFEVSRYQQRGVDEDFSQLPASLNLATDMQRLFGVSDVLLARETKRSKAELDQFLSTAAEADKQAWATAVRDYLSELQRTDTGEGAPSVLQFGDHKALLAYSNEQLAKALEDQYGINTDPSDIKVTIRRPNPAPGIYFPGARPNPQTGQSHYAIETKSLAELALVNVDYLDEVFVAKSRLSLYGEPYTELTTQQVKDLVRDVDIGGSYIEFLNTRLLTSSEARRLKQDFVNVMHKQLRVDAIEAKIAKDYLAHPQDLSYLLVKSVLDQPTDNGQRAKVEGYKVVVAALYVRDILVRGVLAFISKKPKVYTVVLYTPRAKDGRAFREFTGMTQLLEQFINDEAWRDYLFERMDGDALPRLRSTLRRGVFRSEVSLSPISLNFLEWYYDVEARAAIAHADRKTTSTHEANVRSVWTVVEGMVELALAVFPTKITFVIGLVRSAMSLSAALDALQNDDSVGATHQFVRAFTYAVGALVDGAVGFAPIHLTPPARPQLPHNMALKAAPKGVTPLSGWESKGIYTRPGKGSTPGQHFLKEKDRWYKVTYDKTSGTGIWRLQKPRQTAEYQYHLPPLAQNTLNEWVIRSPEYGLRGGYHSRMARDDLTRLYPDLDAQQAARVLDSFDFPAGRERAMELSLVRRLGSGPLELQAIGLRDIPGEFRQYLNSATTLDQARLRLQGIDQSVSGVAVTLPPARPSVIVTNQWRSWGDSLEGASLQAVPETFSVYKHTPVYSRDSGWSQTEGTFIKVADRYYRTTADVTWYDTSVAIRNPNVSYNDFDSFELMLRNNPSEQPMVALYDRGTSTWRVIDRRPFEKPITAYVQDAFPEMSTSTHRQIAREIFNKYHKSFEYVDLLRIWRTGQTSMKDPLSLIYLSVHTGGANPKIHIGRAHEGALPPVWRRVNFEPASFDPHFIHAVTRPGPVTLRGLMAEIMARVVGAELLETSTYGTALLFRRVQDGGLYCVHPVDIHEPFVTDVDFLRVPVRSFGRTGRPGRFAVRENAFPQNAARVRVALGENRLINLIGGILHNRHGTQLPNLFIIRISASPS